MRNYNTVAVLLLRNRQAVLLFATAAADQSKKKEEMMPSPTKSPSSAGNHIVDARNTADDDVAERNEIFTDPTTRSQADPAVRRRLEGGKRRLVMAISSQKM